MQHSIVQESSQIKFSLPLGDHICKSVRCKSTSITAIHWCFGIITSINTPQFLLLLMDSHRLDCVLPRLPTLSPGNVCRKQNGRYFHSGRHRPVSVHALHYGKYPVSSKNNISSSSTLVGGSIDADQYYSIDGKVGCSVTQQLRSGSKLHIGRNGELQSETMRVKEWRHPSKK